MVYIFISIVHTVVYFTVGYLDDLDAGSDASSNASQVSADSKDLPIVEYRFQVDAFCDYLIFETFTATQEDPVEAVKSALHRFHVSSQPAVSQTQHPSLSNLHPHGFPG